MIHQSILKCSGRIDHITTQQKFECSSFSNEMYQALRSSVTRNQSEVYFRLAKSCIFTGNTEVTGHGEFTSTTQCETIYCSYNGFGTLFNSEKYFLSRPCQLHACGLTEP